MKLWTLIGLQLSLLSSGHSVEGSRVLFISAIAAKSQKGFFNALIDSLVDNGHQVTIVSPYKPSEPRENVREIVLADLDITGLLPNLFQGHTLSGPASIAMNAPRICSEALANEEVQGLLGEEFDLGMITIFFSDCFLSLFHQMKIPVMQVCPTGPLGPISWMTGNPTFSSFVTNPFLRSFHPLTFFQRMVNAVADTVSVALLQFFIMPRVEAECRRQGLCPVDMPSLSELKRNATILLVNSVRGLESPPRPAVPAMVYVGGIHCRQPKPLPKDLEEWVAGDGGEDGFLFFSLGSVVKPSNMPEDYRKILVDAFRSLKQRVLWKWDEDTMKDLPPNVRLGKWLPQQDILGDPRLKAFITHGGALSTQESTYHGVPVIGLPVFADQMTNMLEAQEQGWGRVLKWEELSSEILRDTVQDVITDEKLRNEAKRRSILMRDTPQDPRQVVNFWVDYVIRHKGAHHLQSPLLTMPWYQAYNVDVWLTLVGILIVILLLVLKILKILLRCLVSKGKQKID